MNNSKVNKDKKLISFLSSRKTYFVILVLAFIYLFLNDRILNEPILLKLFKWTISCSIVVIVCYFRYIKFKDFYRKKIKDLAFVISALFTTTFFTILIQGFLSIPINLIIILFSSNSQIEYKKCPIVNVITTGIDKVHFMFEEQRYSRYFEVNGHTREDLINNFVLQVAIKRSIGNTYYIESKELQKK